MLLISSKVGSAAQTSNEWVKRAEVGPCGNAGVPPELTEKLKALERENRELRQTNEILRKASACFGQAGPPVEVMIAFIDDHRGELPAPRLSDRAARDAELRPEIEGVFDANFRVYGVRKVEAAAAPRGLRCRPLHGDPPS